MIEPNNRGDELTDFERASFELWSRELGRSRVTRAKEQIQYAAALVSANVVMAGQELKDKIARIPGVRWGISAMAAGLTAMVITSDPDAAYKHHPQPHEEPEV